MAELTTEVGNGSKVYIYNPANSKALTSTAEGTMLASADAVVEDGRLTVSEDMAELTVTVDADGYYTFQSAEGEYLTAGDAVNVLTFEAAASEYSLWTVEEVEGGFYIKNAKANNKGTPLALEVYQSKYTVYTFQMWNTKAFLLQFYTRGVGGFTDTLSAGDQVVLYQPTHNMALSKRIVDTENKKNLAGTEVTLSGGGKLSGYTDADVWTVGVTADGAYTFAARRW